ETDLQVGHPHDGGDDDDAGQRLARAVGDQHAFQLFAGELVGDVVLVDAFHAYAASISRAAWARASSVIAAPESMRAISSQRSSGESFLTVVRVPSGPWLFSMR